MVPKRLDRDLASSGSILNNANEAALSIKGSRILKRIQSALKAKRGAVVIRNVKHNGRPRT